MIKGVRLYHVDIPFGILQLGVGGSAFIHGSQLGRVKIDSRRVRGARGEGIKIVRENQAGTWGCPLGGWPRMPDDTGNWLPVSDKDKRHLKISCKFSQDQALAIESFMNKALHAPYALGERQEGGMPLP